MVSLEDADDQESGEASSTAHGLYEIGINSSDPGDSCHVSALRVGVHLLVRPSLVLFRSGRLAAVLLLADCLPSPCATIVGDAIPEAVPTPPAPTEIY